jgi:uncharacterized membrane protein YfcA
MLTSTVGVASLLSFPVLIALGIPPVVANASNTLGLLPAAMSGSFGYRRELREVRRPTTITVILTCAIGAVGGAALLLGLPPGVFAFVAPWLILFTCLIVGVQPWITRWLRSRHEEPQGERMTMTPTTTFFAALTGVYGGYFGAGAGVMMMAVLGLGLDLDLRIVNALKTLALLAANLGRRRLCRLPHRPPPAGHVVAGADRAGRHHRRRTHAALADRATAVRSGAVAGAAPGRVSVLVDAAPSGASAVRARSAR